MSLNNSLRKALGAVSGILYNGTAEGGFPDDKKRINQSIFPQKRTACDRGVDPVLHLQIRLHEERRTGLCMALDTLRATVWPSSDVPLDRAGWRLPGWRDRPVCAELHYRRRDRRLRPGMAADRGGLVCAADGVPADRWMIFASWKYGKLPLVPMEKPFTT